MTEPENSNTTKMKTAAGHANIQVFTSKCLCVILHIHFLNTVI